MSPLTAIVHSALDHSPGPGGRIVVEEVAWERLDRAAADFLHDNRALLVDAGLLDASTGDRLDAWVAGHGHLRRGDAVPAALDRVGTGLVEVPTAILWRPVEGRGDAWTRSVQRVADALEALRHDEGQRVADHALPLSVTSPPWRSARPGRC